MCGRERGAGGGSGRGAAAIRVGVSGGFDSGGGGGRDGGGKDGPLSRHATDTAHMLSATCAPALLVAAPRRSPAVITAEHTPFIAAICGQCLLPPNALPTAAAPRRDPHACALALPRRRLACLALTLLERPTRAPSTPAADKVRAAAAAAARHAGAGIDSVGPRGQGFPPPTAGAGHVLDPLVCGHARPPQHVSAAAATTRVVPTPTRLASL